MKFSLLHAGLILLGGMLLLILSAFLKISNVSTSDPLILSGLSLEFLGTLWLVLGLNQRRKKKQNS